MTYSSTIWQVFSVSPSKRMTANIQIPFAMAREIIKTCHGTYAWHLCSFNFNTPISNAKSDFLSYCNKHRPNNELVNRCCQHSKVCVEIVIYAPFSFLLGSVFNVRQENGE